MMNKEAARKKIRALRSEISEQERKERDALIRERLYQLSSFQEADTFFSFVSHGTEVDTKQIISELLQKGKRVAVPKVIGREMRFSFISSLDELKEGCMGILEPVSDNFTEEREGVMLMPGLAFDREKNRVGYGGGYYDRYLAGENSFVKVAVAYDFQIVDKIEAEESDIRPDRIVTDERVI